MSPPCAFELYTGLNTKQVFRSSCWLSLKTMWSSLSPDASRYSQFLLLRYTWIPRISNQVFSRSALCVRAGGVAASGWSSGENDSTTVALHARGCCRALAGFQQVSRSYFSSPAFTKRLEFDPLRILLFQVNRQILVGQIHQPNPTPGFPQNILNLDLQYVNAVAPCLLKKQLILEEEGQPAPSLQVAGPFTAGQSMALASQQLLKSVQVSCRVIYCHMGSSVPFSLPAPFQTWSMLRDLHWVYSPKLAPVPNSSVELVYKR